MKDMSMLQRPPGRIDRVLSRLQRLWHYYPACSLAELVLETTVFANRVKSNLPPTSMAEIEDIAYPEGHLLHGLRHLEMGIDRFETFHANEPLPPVPIQVAILRKFAARWHRQPQLRLGQMLTLLTERRMSPLELAVKKRKEKPGYLVTYF